MNPDCPTAIIDRFMRFAEVIPWGQRWAAQIPRVIGPCIAADHVEALAELRQRIKEDISGVAARLWRRESEVCP